jgi:hypothetical protein
MIEKLERELRALWQSRLDLAERLKLGPKAH